MGISQSGTLMIVRAQSNGSHPPNDMNEML